MRRRCSKASGSIPAASTSCGAYRAAVRIRPHPRHGDSLHGESNLSTRATKSRARRSIENGYVRPVVFRGSEMMSVAAQNTKTHVAIAVWQWPSYFDPKEKLKGIRLTISEWKRPAPDTAPTKAKAAGLYMICTLSKHAAEAAGLSRRNDVSTIAAMSPRRRARMCSSSGRQAAYAHSRLLPRRHHAPFGDGAGARAANSRHRAAYRAEGAGRLYGMLPHRHSRRSHSGCRDRTRTIQTWRPSPKR